MVSRLTPVDPFSPIHERILNSPMPWLPVPLKLHLQLIPETYGAAAAEAMCRATTIAGTFTSGVAGGFEGCSFGLEWCPAARRQRALLTRDMGTPISILLLPSPDLLL